MHYPEHLNQLIAQLKKFPSVGARTAERFAFHLLEWSEKELEGLGQSLLSIKEHIQNCTECGALTGKGSCPFCSGRENDTLCVVSSAKDIFNIEGTKEYRGLYHVIGSHLSPLQKRAPTEHNLEKLKERISALGVKEVILALDSTLEGDATSLFLKKELTPLPVEISRLALGLPMGSSLDYIDGGTLARALSGRTT